MIIFCGTAQGVNLDSIVKEYHPPSTTGSTPATKHKVIEAVESLQQCLDSAPGSASLAPPTNADLPPAEGQLSSDAQGDSEAFGLLETCAFLYDWQNMFLFDWQNIRLAVRIIL